MPDQSLQDQLALKNLAMAISHAPTSETTTLSAPDEKQFQQWTQANGIKGVDDPDSHYDMRGYWKDIASKGQSETGINAEDGKLHYPDTYKQHGHPTFSVESKYSTGPADGGRWLDDTLIQPPMSSHTVTDTATGTQRPVLMPSHIPDPVPMASHD